LPVMAAFEKEREGREDERGGRDDQKHLASSGAKGIHCD
jgi:hypothetical protein